MYLYMQTQLLLVLLFNQDHTQYYALQLLIMTESTHISFFNNRIKQKPYHNYKTVSNIKIEDRTGKDNSLINVISNNNKPITKILKDLNELIEQSLKKSSKELDESNFLNFNIVAEILKNQNIQKLKSVNAIKYVFLEFIILVKQIFDQSDNYPENLEPIKKIDLYVPRSPYTELKDNINLTKLLINQSSLLFSQIIYENNEILCQNKTKRSKVQRLQKQFDGMKKKLIEFSGIIKNKENAQIEKDIEIKNLQQLLRDKEKKLAFTTQTLQSQQQKYKLDIVKLNQELYQKNIDMNNILKNKMSSVNLSEIPDDLVNRSKSSYQKFSNSSSHENNNQSDLYHFLLIQSLTIQKII